MDRPCGIRNEAVRAAYHIHHFLNDLARVFRKVCLTVSRSKFRINRSLASTFEKKCLLHNYEVHKGVSRLLSAHCLLFLSILFFCTEVIYGYCTCY